MGLLQKLKSTLGLGGSQDRRGPDRTGDSGVTVEHEPDASGEAAVKGTDDEAVTEDESVTADEPTVDDEASADESAADEPPTEDEAPAGADATDAADADATDETGAAGADVPVDELSGIGPAYAERLGNAGVESVADLASADAASLAEEADVPQGRLEDWIERAREY